MNCRQGDIAIVVRGPRAGVMVECLRFVGHYECANGQQADDCWLLRSLCSFRFNFEWCGDRDEGYGRDSSLRPIGTHEDVESGRELEAA